MENIHEGIEFLGITSQSVILDVLKSKYENEWWHAQKNRYNDRHKIPSMLTKKELNARLKKIQEHIDYYTEQIRKNWQYPMDICRLEKEEYIEDKKRINKILKLHTGFGSQKQSLEKAKEHPLEQLLDFTGGFTKCIFHDDSKPSMKLYKNNNKVHCFVCNKSFDSIDIYQKLFNVDFNTAVKKLS